MPRSRGKSAPAGAAFSVETTVSSRRQALALARSATTARLAACAWILPLRSLYWWNGKLKAAREQLVVFKTHHGAADRLRRFLESHHPYEVPYIATHRLARVAPAYLRWMANEARPKARR